MVVKGDSSLLPYRSTGPSAAPALVFLHGFLGSALDWADIVERLPEVRCLAVDLPGHGRNLACGSLESYSLAGATRGLLALMDGLDIRQCIPVGYSMGGRLALYVAVHYPERCIKVVVESGSPGLARDSERRNRRKWDEQKAQELEHGDFEEFLARWYAQTLFDSLTREKGRFQKVLEARRRNDPLELAKSLRAMGTGSQDALWNRLGTLDVPVLAIAGEHDAKYRKMSRDMVSLCKKGEYVVVANAGHNVHVENPGDYVRAIRQHVLAPLSI